MPDFGRIPVGSGLKSGLRQASGRPGGGILSLARLDSGRNSIREFSFRPGIIIVAARWEAFYIDNKRLDLDTLKVPNQSHTLISKSNDFLGQAEDIRGVRSLHFRPMLGVPGVPAGLTNTYFLALGSPGDGPGSKHRAGCTTNHARRPIINPMRWHFVLMGPTAKR